MSDESALATTTPSRMAVPTQAPTGIPSTGRLPYVGFRGKKAEKRVDELEAAGVKVNQFYLQDGETIPLEPCDIHLLDATKALVLSDKDTGEILGVTFDNTDENWKAGYRPKMLAVVVARLSNGKGVSYVPATLMLSSEQTKALEAADSLLRGAASNDAAWASRSAKHAASAGIKSPGGRFFVRIRNQVQKTDTGRDKNVGYGSIIPTPETEVDAFNAWAKSEEAPTSRLNAVFAQHDKRVKELRDRADGIYVEE